MKWSAKDIETVRRIVGDATPAPVGAHEEAARAVGATVSAVRSLLHRMRSGEEASEGLAADLAQHRHRERLSGLTSDKKLLLSELSAKEEQIAFLTGLRAAKPAAPVVASRKGKDPKQRSGVPVMLCSDWHVEEEVLPETVNGLNEYSLAIADRCITRMAEGFEWMLRDPRYDCRAGVVWLGGDLFSGFIHEELQERNALSPVQACLWLQDRLERMLRTIAANCPNLDRILVPCNDGNHGRTTHKIRCATRTANSYEWFLYQNLAHRLKDDPRFEFQIADGEYNYLDVFDQTLCFFHGDSVRSQGGVGGILVPMKRGLNELRKYRKVDIFNCGHFHQYINHGDIVVNGSMIGVNAYAMRNKFPPERRQQAWYMLDSTYGKCLSAPIILDESTPIARAA